MKFFATCTAVCLSFTLFSASAFAEKLPVDVQLQVSQEVAAHIGGRLASPVPGARVTSGFGWRMHPTLRRARFHAGMDFGGPIGTPVLAAGAGVVEKIVRARDRGLYVVIRHDERLVSGYAHLSAIAPGLAVGQTVAMGERIGSIGRSGRTSGPHLDLEIFVDGQRVDPTLSVAGLGPEAQPATWTVAANDSGPTGNQVRGKMVSFNDR